MRPGPIAGSAQDDFLGCRVGQAFLGLPWRDLVPAVLPDAELHLAGNDERPRCTGPS